MATAIRQANPEAGLELAGDRQLIIMTPDGGDTGAGLGWWLIPHERALAVWGPLGSGEQGRRIEAAIRLEGGPGFPGLTLDLEPIWEV